MIIPIPRKLIELNKRTRNQEKIVRKDSRSAVLLFPTRGLIITGVLKTISEGRWQQYETASEPGEGEGKPANRMRSGSKQS